MMDDYVGKQAWLPYTGHTVLKEDNGLNKTVD